MSKKILFVNDLFVTPDVQLANIRKWNEQGNWGFTEEDFSIIGRSRPRWPKGPLQALVLTPYLKSPKATYDALVGVAKSEAGIGVWAPLETWHVPELHLLGGIKHRSGLRWSKIDFGTNLGYSALDTHARDTKSAPHAEVLAAVAHFPVWVECMDGDRVPYVVIPGYGYTNVFGDGWVSCLAVSTGWDKENPRGHVIRTMPLSGWDEQHAVAEFVGPNLGKYLYEHCGSRSLYHRAAFSRMHYDRIVARYTLAEIVRILSAQPGKAAGVETILEVFNARHEAGWNGVQQEAVQHDIDAALQSLELTQRVTVEDGPTGKQVILRR